ncbi:MAG: 3-hydroxyacyl-CoA dehydrogenase family protein [Bacteroidota bacterium]
MGKSKSTKKLESARKKSEEPRRTRVYIVGESPMVEEYAELCGIHGFEVFVEWNEQPAAFPTFTAQTIKRARTIPSEISLALELTNTDLDRKRKNIQNLDRALPPTSAIVSSSVTVTATEQSTWAKYRNRLVGVSALPTLIQKPLVEVAPTVFSPKETIEVIQRFFHSLGKELALVQDRIGLVLPRILCQLINEASFALQEQIATPQDLDTAMKLGTGFPLGPIEWADKIGMKQVYAVLSALQRDLQEDRYRISPLLAQLAQGGTWWKQA